MIQLSFFVDMIDLNSPFSNCIMIWTNFKSAPGLILLYSNAYEHHHANYENQIDVSPSYRFLLTSMAATNRTTRYRYSYSWIVESSTAIIINGLCRPIWIPLTSDKGLGRTKHNYELAQCAMGWRKPQQKSYSGHIQLLLLLLNKESPL